MSDTDPVQNPSPAAASSPALHSPSDEHGSYVVVARRYRPQTFDDLVGQEHVADALVGAIRSNRVGHAYLFSGARGVGKTSCARILAKALNCAQGPTASPCNRCDLCMSISAGDDVDVLEIDGASNRGIEEMRELRQNVNIRPSRSRFKIYIIDEVHMLTREAFNALLKTLEEPPEHVKFVLCTTEPEKIPVTILSRCQRFDFAGIQSTSIVSRLRQIVDSEGVAVEDEALEILARRAAGSMRDSQSLLEQLLSLGVDRIQVADVHRMLGTAGSGRLAALVESLVEEDAAAALAQLDQSLAEGVDVGQLLDQLLGYFRDLMVACVGGSPDLLIHASADERGQVIAASGKLGVAAVLAAMQIIDHTLARLRYSTHARSLAELAIVRICQLGELDAIPDLIGRLLAGEPAGSVSSPPSSRRSAAGLRGQASHRPQESPSNSTGTRDVANRRTASATPNPGAPSGSGDSDIADSQMADDPSDGTGLSESNATAVWERAISRLSDLTAEQARHCDRVAFCAPNRLVVTFGGRYTHCKAFFERADQLARLEASLAAECGRAIRVEFAIADDEPEAQENGNPSAPPPGESPQQRLAEVADHPFVRRALDLFQAEALRCDGPE